MWKFKSLKGRDKWLFLLTIGIILCILAFPADRLARQGIRERQENTAEGDAPGTGGIKRADGFGGGAGEEESSQAGGGWGEDGAVPAAAGANSSYEAELERRVREILKNVEGVGEVDVMIVLKSSAEKVVHVDGSSSRSLTEEQDSSGGTRKVENQEQEHNTAMISGGGQNTPMVAKELCPEISGIIISAQGGGAPGVRAEISAAMEALFGLPAHKIKVLKRVE